MLKVVVVNKFLWENPSGEPHVLELVHVRRQVKILDVDGHEFSPWCRDDTIKKNFGGGNVGVGGEGFTCVVDLISADRYSDAIRVGFLSSVFAHNSGISCFFVAWLSPMVDEVGGVGSHEAALFASLG